jgi:hypothetical protein
MYDATTPALYGIATLASIILLFLSGLETNLKMFLRYSFVGSLVGFGGVVFSFVFGDVCAVMLLPKFFPSVFGNLAQMPFGQAIMQAAPMYMGIMSTATSVGITARVSKNAIVAARREGIKVGMIRPITLYPFPKEPLAKAASKVKSFLTVELNMGQMNEDVKLAINCSKPVNMCNRVGGMIPSADEVLAAIRKEAK